MLHEAHERSPLHEAHERSPRTVLTPIPETSGCSSRPAWESVPEPTERTGSVRHRVTLSDATTPRQSSVALALAADETGREEIPPSC